MRTNVTFRHPAPYVPISDADGILSTEGAEWFAELLRRIPNIQVDSELCQEDWGVVAFGSRNKMRFWIGLSPYDEQMWLIHFHHGSFAFLQWFSRSGKSELQQLTIDFHEVLKCDRLVTDVLWYEERAMTSSNPTGFATPSDE